jgi:hypothetical protein
MTAAASARYYEKNKATVQLRRRIERRANPAQAILADARRADRKRGRECDLDLDFIRAAVGAPCVYCGETEIRMTLDRVDNSLGHAKANVVGACERCNYLRRDMPYEAWLVVALGMRAARERGLFGTWTGGIHHRHALPARPVSDRKTPEHGTTARYKTCGPQACEACLRAISERKRELRARDATSVAAPLSRE